MSPRIPTLCLCLVLSTTAALTAQQTPGGMVESYDALASSILAMRRLESGFIGALLEGHQQAAEQALRRGDPARAAAEIVLFADEGGAGIREVRRRLLAAGHRHHPDDDRYEPGFVIVTREARREILAAAAALQEASTEREREEAWKAFQLAAEALLIAG